MSELRNVCFDVLGDFVDPKTIEIDERAGYVFVWVPPGTPTNHIRDDWNRAVRGTDLERVRFVMAIRP